jgi:hypothetical protein
MRYGTNFQSCEPQLTSTAASLWKQPGCSFGLDLNQQVASRTLNAEASRAFANNRINTRARGDEAYSALWCSTIYNDTVLDPALPACDTFAVGNNLGASNLTDNFLKIGKWGGFYFGMGMAHQWPAVRLLGSTSGSPRLNGGATATGTIR